MNIRFMGHARGSYRHVRPNEHVNMSQSTNDVDRMALRVSPWLGVTRLLKAMTKLRTAFAAKSEEFRAYLNSIRKARGGSLEPAPSRVAVQEAISAEVIL